MALQTVVVVGASLAGLRATEALRRDGFDGRVVLVGAEPHLPYDRPPLSKQLLAGEWEPQELALRRAPYDELELDLRLGVRATALDAAAKVLTLELGDGTQEELAFDGALLATGATPRTLPNTPDLDGIFVLRTVDDALDLRARLADHPRVVVIGAGFIGSEVAATCRGRGLSVTVLEALPAPLVRGLGETLGTVCGELHRDHGVDLRLGVGVAGIEGDGKVERVRLDDGSAVDADVVVVGVGVVPVTDWLEGSGLTLDNGVVCDETLLAAPGIVAAGDVARWPNPMFDGEMMRLEHWTNAAEQGVAAARRLLVADDADAVPYAPVPFVWSDQYDRKIQTVGHFRGDDEMAVVHGTLEERRFVAVFGRGGRLVGALGFSMPAKVMQYRKMIEERASFEDALERAPRVVRLRRTDDTAAAQPPLMTARFVVVMISGFCYFSAMGAMLPVIPRYVDKRLGGNDIAVGLAVGALAVGAILLRPIAGRVGDRFGRRVLMIGGAFIVGTTALCAGLVEALEWMIATRVIMGLGEACFFVGATTMATDLAPEARRGEAVSYWSVALWGGLAFGPVLGELLLNGSNYDLVWYVAGGLGLTAAAVALFTKETHVGGHEERGRLIAPEAIRPGILLAATLIGITGFSIFLPLYAPDVGVDDVGPLFLVYGVVVVFVRIFGAKLPDRLGPIHAGTIAIGATTVGLATLALWQSTIGLVVATVIVAVGSSFLYPSMLLLVLRGVPENQRGSVVGTFSAFFDFAAGASGIVLGGLAAASSYAGAFAGSAVLAAVALVLLRTGFARHESGDLLTVTEVGTASVEPTSLP